MRGSMVDLYNIVPGVGHSALALDGPVFADTFPFLTANLLGDVVYQGTANGTATTLAAAVTPAQITAGATSVQSAASLAAGTQFQIDTGNNAEIRTVSSVTGAGPFTLNFTQALRVPHASGVAVTPVGAPYMTLCSVLNGGGVGGQAQPATHTLTDINQVTTAGARQYSSLAVEEIALKISPEALYTHSSKAQAFLSAPASAPITGLAASGVGPTAGWQSSISLAGTAVGSIESADLTLKRVIQVIQTADGTQQPYQIRRGPVSVEGKYRIIARDESPLLAYLAQNNVALSFAVDNGAVGAGQLQTRLDVGAARYITGTKIARDKEAVAFEVQFASIPTASLAGWSGGVSPVRCTHINAIAPNTYA
jgi:hypothetical protein